MVLGSDLAAELANLVGPEKVIAEPSTVARLSRDFHWYSQILEAELYDKRAEVAVQPTTEADVLALVEFAVRTGTPITPRGAGTGNYGQAVPLRGGILLDMSRMNRVLA